MRSALLFILLTFSLYCAYAQDDTDSEDYEEDSESYDYTESESSETQHELISPDKLNNTQQYKAEKVTVKPFDDKKWKELVGNEDYQEKVEEREIKPKEEEDEEEDEERGSSGLSSIFSSPITRIIFYIIASGIIVLLLYFVMKNTSLDIKLKRKEVGDDPEDPVENIEELDIYALLQHAKAQGNFRLAIRLYYLLLLKTLNAQGIIVWKKDKTNKDYLMEVFTRNYHFDEMKKATYSYEEVWYGERTLTPESFEKLTTNFETVYQRINTQPVS